MPRVGSMFYKTHPVFLSPSGSTDPILGLTTPSLSLTPRRPILILFLASSIPGLELDSLSNELRGER